VKYTIQNKYLSATVAHNGIELCSIKSKATDVEYMWQGNPDIWGSHAPVLFPIIGMLKNEMYYFEDESYSMPKHGLVRSSDKNVLLKQTDDSLLFSMKWDEELLKQYPFKFEIQTRFILKERVLQVQHTIFNHDAKTMYFSLGGHPAFNCPFCEDETYEDYFLEFEHSENASTYLLAPDNTISNNTELMLDGTKKLPLHSHLFDRDALIFKDLKSRSVNLNSRNNGKILTVNYDGFPYLGIWAKPKAPFVCIEPWLGIADTVDTDQHLINKEGIQSLASDKEFEASYEIEIH